MTCKDITNVIKTIASLDVLWSISEFFVVIEQLKNNSEYRISFWETEENWASIQFEDEIVGYLWKRYPLFFVNFKHKTEISKCLNEYVYIAFIEVEDFANRQFKMDYSELRNEIDFKIEYEIFSVEDLWFGTNSI